MIPYMCMHVHFKIVFSFIICNEGFKTMVLMNLFFINGISVELHKNYLIQCKKQSTLEC
jgi:hypothetical protein